MSEPIVTELAVSGMSCAHCARSVNEALSSVAGVALASISLEEGRARVQWKPGQAAAPANLINAVQAAGYEAKALSDAPEAKSAKRFGSWGFNVVLGACCTAPLLVGQWIFGWEMERWFQWTGFALALPVQVICGAGFYRGAWRQLKSGNSNMDTLAALGSTTAFVYSLWALLFTPPGGHLFFAEAAAILTLIGAGHWMERRMSRRAESSLRALLDLAPRQARRRNADGTITETSAALLKPGDIIVLAPGERISADAAIVEGRSAVNESMLTGESLPVDKAPGSNVFGGSINIDGQLAARVTATGEATVLAHIIAAVQRAQNSRANIQRLADRVSSVFVPIIVIIALATGLWHGLAPEQARAVHAFLGRFLWPSVADGPALSMAILCAAAVLIAACPCAMGLATPVAIMAATNAAARRGILIRDGIALEKAGRITTIVFDKTGTLTTGKPSITRTLWLESDGSRVQSLASALAQPSKHPLSRAVAHLDATPVQLDDWRELRGQGVQAQWAGPDSALLTARMGSLAWLRDSGVDIGAGASFESECAGEGGTVIGIALGNRLAGLIALRDSLKPGVQQVVTQLKAAGLKTVLITGDNPRAAQTIASHAGIDEVFSGVRPEGKAELVKQLQQRGDKVAFVGDGINDAPALEQADLGIAVAQASDAASEAADIVLLRPDIGAIVQALGLARATLRTIKQNLFWAFFYNAAAVPLAALGFISPVLCAAAMGLSDLVVVGNALRLNRRRFE